MNLTVIPALLKRFLLDSGDKPKMRRIDLEIRECQNIVVMQNILMQEY